MEDKRKIERVTIRISDGREKVYEDLRCVLFVGIKGEDDNDVEANGTIIGNVCFGDMIHMYLAAADTNQQMKEALFVAGKVAELGVEPGALDEVSITADMPN